MDMGQNRNRVVFRRGREGFTLIELLVVVAIISLLVSIMLPSMFRVKDLTRRTVCAGQLHLLGVAMHIYAKENNAVLPRPPIHPDAGHVTFALDPEMMEFLKGQGLWYEALICPTLDRSDENTFFWDPGYRIWRIGYSFATGYNPFEGIYGYPNPVPSSAMFLTDPPDRVMLADVNCRAEGRFDRVWGKREDIGTPLTSHRVRGSLEPEGGHSVFLDGHLKWFRADELGPDGGGIHTEFGNYDYGYGKWWGGDGRDTFWGVYP